MSVCSGAPQLSTINGFTALRYITNLAVVATRVSEPRFSDVFSWMRDDP